LNTAPINNEQKEPYYADAGQTDKKIAAGSHSHFVIALPVILNEKKPALERAASLKPGDLRMIVNVTTESKGIKDLF